MGICMDTGRNRLLPVNDINVGPSTFGSWPRQLNGSLRYQRVVPQARTMSEPIMVVSNQNHNTVDKISPAETSSSGPGPPKRIPLTLQRKITPIESSPPDIPIIFVLGGPGSGKITHCNRLAAMDERLFHMNMQTTFLQMASEIGSRDPNIVPAYKALETLIDDVPKISGIAALIITGYPRNMRDVVEYMARVQRVDGVILLDWSDRSLERQIQLGAKSGDIDINLARFEMNNHRSNVIPVAQFFDQQGQLHIVAGQRQPSEVFDDLAEEINGILSGLINDQPVRPSAVPIEIQRPVSGRQDEINLDESTEETRVVIHTSPEISVKRQQSIDSVDLMIEEEIKHIEEEETPKEHIQSAPSKERSQSAPKSASSVNKDIIEVTS